MNTDVDAIIFTDGGARPHPGFGGWGMCVMHVEETNPYIVPDLSSEKSPIHSFGIGEGEYVASTAVPDTWNAAAERTTDTITLHKADKIVDLWGTLDGRVTSNACEITAYINALDYILENKLQNTVILSDSTHTVNGANKLKDLKALPDNGKPIPNKKLWVKLNDKLLELDKLGYTNVTRWIKGHGVSIGNARADANATRGVAASTNGIKIDIEKAEFVIGKKIPEPDKIHGLLMETSWYFVPSANSKTEDYYVYATGNHGKPSNKSKEFDWLGKDRSSSSIAVTALREPSKILETIKERHLATTSSPDSICVGKLRDIGMRKLRTEVDAYGSTYLYKPHNALGLVSSDGTVVTSEVNPPMLAYRLLSQAEANTALMFAVIKDELSKDFPLVNITDYIYETNGKKKTLQKKYSGLEKSVVMELEELKEVPITLTLGIDLPSKNALARICSGNPEVFVLLCPESDVAYRYYVYIKTDTGHSLTSAYKSNLVVVNQ